MKKYFLFFSIAVIFWTCQEEENSKPICSIAFPENNASFDVGDTILLSIDAIDPDGDIVPSINIYINSISKAEVPLINGNCEYELITSGFDEGTITISATATDLQGEYSESTIKVQLIKVNKPTVSLKNVEVVSANSVILTGEILSDGGAEIKSCGFILEKNVDDSRIIKTVSSQDITNNIFELEITDFELYEYFAVKWAFASNKIDTAYSSEEWVIFYTSPEDKGIFTDNRDGNEYGWVKYGSQYWMTDNLAYLPQVNNCAELVNVDQEIYMVYNYTPDENKSEMDQIDAVKELDDYKDFGVLYNYTVVEKNEVCPAGWHIPSIEEWDQMISYLTNFRTISQDNIGNKMATKTGWEAYPYVDGIGFNDEWDNSLYFSIVAGGLAYKDGVGFGLKNEIGYYWSGSISPTQTYYPVRVKSFDYSNPGVDSNNLSYTEGASIRCVKD